MRPLVPIVFGVLFILLASGCMQADYATELTCPESRCISDGTDHKCTICAGEKVTLTSYGKEYEIEVIAVDKVGNGAIVNVNGNEFDVDIRRPGSYFIFDNSDIEVFSIKTVGEPVDGGYVVLNIDKHESYCTTPDIDGLVTCRIHAGEKQKVEIDSKEHVVEVVGIDKNGKAAILELDIVQFEFDIDDKSEVSFEGTKFNLVSIDLEDTSIQITIQEMA